MKNIRTARGLLASLALVAGASLAACGSSNDLTGNSSSDTSSLAMSSDEVSVTKQWARTSAMASTMGAVYLDIVASAGDELVGVNVDPSVAAAAEIHQTVMSDDHSMSSDTTMMGGSSMSSDTTMMSGEMKMQQIETLAVPLGETVSLKPGGYHIMLVDLVQPLETGSSFALTLTFATAGDVTIEVPVRDEAP